MTLFAIICYLKWKGLDDKKIQPVLSSEDFGSLGFDVNDELEQPDKFYFFSQAEVRGIQQDGLHLQARSQKYGKVCLLHNL